MRFVLLLACLFIIANASAQAKKRYADTVINDNVYHYLGDYHIGDYRYEEQMPEPGYDLGNYLKEHLHYPAEAKKKKIQGRVLVRFVVNEDGSISNCKIVKGIGGGCDQEAGRVVRNMPRWKTPKKNWKPTKVFFTLPIVFSL